MTDAAPDKLVLIELRHYPVVPEFCLYTASHFAEEVGLDNISVVFAKDEDDFRLAEQTVEDLKGEGAERITVLLWHYWHSMPYGTLDHFLGLAGKFKDDPNVRVCTAGLHQTLVPDMFAGSGLFDCVVAGFPWNDDAWIRWGGEEGSVVHAQQAVDFDEKYRLRNSFHRLLNPESIKRHEKTGTGTGYYVSYGCRGGCSFCWQVPYCQSYHGLNPKNEANLWDDIDFLSSECGIDRLDTLDANILEDKEFGMRFLDTISSRPDIDLYNTLGLRVADLTPEVVEVVHRAGVQTMFIGLESLERQCQLKIGKAIDMERLENALRAADEKNIEIEGNLLVGIQAVFGKPMVDDDIRDMVRDAIPFFADHPNLRIQFRPYMPYVGTPAGDRIWADRLETVDALGLKGYLDLINRVLFGLEIEEGMSLPPCFADRETFATAGEAHAAFRSLSEFKAGLYNYPPKRKEKAEFLDEVMDHCLQLAGDMNFGFTTFLDKTVKLTAKWL